MFVPTLLRLFLQLGFRARHAKIFAELADTMFLAFSNLKTDCGGVDSTRLVNRSDQHVSDMGFTGGVALV
jgi:hypothetical protein